MPVGARTQDLSFATTGELFGELSRRFASGYVAGIRAVGAGTDAEVYTFWSWGRRMEALGLHDYAGGMLRRRVSVVEGCDDVGRSEEPSEGDD